MKSLYTEKSIPKSHELASEESVQELSAWIDERLSEIEIAFTDFVTKESTTLDLKSSRKKPA